MIEIKHFTKKYAEVTAVDNMDLTFHSGKVSGLLGPNGAGKSTTVKSIVGIQKPTSGTILVHGKEVTRYPLETKSLLGYVPENPVLFTNLTGKEHLTLVGKLYHVEETVLQKRTSDLLDRFGLQGKSDDQILTYSKGMQQKLVIATAVLHNPQVLILDEPLNGLDATAAAVLKEVIRTFASRGKTVLFCSHMLEVVERLCGSITILDEGRILASGTSTEVVNGAGSNSLEEAFISLTGQTDVSREAADILSALE